MNINVFPSGPTATNAYVIACPTTKEAAIVDPGIDSAESIKNYIEQSNLEPIMILLTHSHWDHIGNVEKLKQYYNIPVYIHPNDLGNLQNPGSDGLPLWEKIEAADANEFLNDGLVIIIGKLQLEVIYTPGHTPGGVCLYDKQNGVLFSGDTLFKGSIGNLSFPTADSNKMWTSLERLSRLPPKTVVYSGHGETTTIGDESWLPEAKKIFG